MSLSATITDIQRFSVHDGPGIRTTVFVKGCNMHCTWCHNPETLSFEPQTFFYPDLCIGCGLCDEGCYAGAKVDCGKEMTLEEVLAVILEDKPYYGQEGGVTLSGGEPTCRPEFSGALLAACKREGIGTAIETNMSTPWKNILESVRHADLVMCDLKDADEERHLRLTGARIEIIRENILRVSAELEKPILLRTPIIPGVNADVETISQIAAFAATLPTLVAYELLPYHPLGVDKARALGTEAIRYEKPSLDLIHTLASAAGNQVNRVRVAGILR